MTLRRGDRIAVAPLLLPISFYFCALHWQHQFTNDILRRISRPPISSRMTDATRHEAGLRLAEDLRNIRESRMLTIQDVNNETKIPVSVLTAFEKTALFDQEQFNRVYLRSVIRSYAAVVRIPAEVAAEALEAAFEGTYDGSLGREYGSGASSQEKRESKTSDPGTEDSATTRLAEERPSVPGRGRKEQPSEEVPPAAKTPETKKQTKEEIQPPFVAPASKRSPDADWTTTSPPSRRPPKEPKKKSSKPRSERPVKQRGGSAGWMFVVVGIIALAAIIWVLASVVGGGDRMPEEPTAAVDAEAVDPEPTPEPVEQRPVVTLGDVMEFYVIAEDGVLDPIRVTVDNDVRRPYWIEQGDSMRFEAQERIVFEELLDRIRLTIEGHDFPTDRRDDQGRIVVTRETARAYFDGDVQ